MRGRHHHRSGDGDAVGRGERVGFLEHDDQCQNADQQHDVDARGMKICPSCVSEVCWISMRGRRPSWMAWRAKEIGAGDDGLAGDHGRRPSTG